MSAAGTTGQLIYVEGIDGAGKSTVVDRIRAEHDCPDLLFLSKTGVRAADPVMRGYLDQINEIVYRRPSDIGAQCGERYWLFALAAWYEALDRLSVRPAMAAGRTVVLDNSPLKIVARYLAGGEIEPELVSACFAGLRRPDLTLVFDVEPSEALRRKGSFTAVEAGGTTLLTDYLAYQGAVRRMLTTSVGDAESRIIIDTTGRDVDDVVAVAWSHISQLVSPSRARARPGPPRYSG